jgi:hypothetical protein
MSGNDDPLIREISRVVTVTKESEKSKDNEEGFVFYTKMVRDKTPTIITDKKTNTKRSVYLKRPKTFVKKSLPVWGIMTPIIDEFMSDMNI